MRKQRPKNLTLEEIYVSNSKDIALLAMTVVTVLTPTKIKAVNELKVSKYELINYIFFVMSILAESLGNFFFSFSNESTTNRMTMFSVVQGFLFTFSFFSISFEQVD